MKYSHEQIYNDNYISRIFKNILLSQSKGKNKSDVKNNNKNIMDNNRMKSEANVGYALVNITNDYFPAEEVSTIIDIDHSNIIIDGNKVDKNIVKEIEKNIVDGKKIQNNIIECDSTQLFWSDNSELIQQSLDNLSYRLPDRLLHDDEFVILKKLYCIKQHVIEAMQSRKFDSKNSRMEINIFTYMDMCPSCWTVWNECFSELKTLYNINGLTVNMYSMKPYNMTLHKYLTYLNTNSNETSKYNKQYKNPIFGSEVDVCNWGQSDIENSIRRVSPQPRNDKFNQYNDLYNLKLLNRFNEHIVKTGIFQIFQCSLEQLYEFGGSYNYKNKIKELINQKEQVCITQDVVLNYCKLFDELNKTKCEDKDTFKKLEKNINNTIFNHIMGTWEELCSNIVIQQNKTYNSHIEVKNMFDNIKKEVDNIISGNNNKGQ